jgi:hypothetical protein
LYAALLAAAVLLGRGLTRREERRLGAPRQCRVGPFERSVGAMLAFLLGFTFAMAGGDFRETQAVLQRESDAIAEASRWGRLLPEADRAWFEDGLRAYTDRLVRYDAAPTHGPEAVAADREIRAGQAQLWEGLAARRAAAAERAPFDACLRAVNQFTQAYDQGYYLSRRRLPEMVLLFVLAAPVLIGFLVGYTSESQPGHFAVLASLFVVFLTGIIYLIWEVNRPTEGLITVSRQNLIDLADRLRGSPPVGGGAGASPLVPAWTATFVPVDEGRGDARGRRPTWLAASGRLTPDVRAEERKGGPMARAADDRVRLLHSPYKAPRLRKGDQAACLFRDCEVIVTGWTAARIAWPRCRPLDVPRTHPSLLVDEELARAVRTESAAAVRFWWGVSVAVVWK